MSGPVTSLSGYPEWLPRERIAEQLVVERIRRVFELHGFTPIETRAVEPIEQLSRGGEIDKEVYLLRRLRAGSDDDAGLGLHYDLTVPFARYVGENAGRLDFPFRRYQIQKVWRGERPQEGRFREFLQADVDVVDRDALAAQYEVEIPLVIGEALGALPIPQVRILVNNRLLAEACYRQLGATDPVVVLRVVDKLAKIGPDAVERALVEEARLEPTAARLCLRLGEIRGAGVDERLHQLGFRGAEVDRGLEELLRVVDGVNAVRPGLVEADLSIARGLDYYTGTVYETVLTGHEDLGSVSSGGRYDSLAGDGKSRYPGVGMSIGVSRLLVRLFGAVTASRAVPTCVLVAVPSEEQRARSAAVAERLRARGIPVEVAPRAEKYGKQIRYADRRGIPFVWFPGEPDTVKDIRSGEQIPADAAVWEPPEHDRWPSLVGRLDGRGESDDRGSTT